MPHFLAFYEKSVPMVVVWVGAEEPVVSLSCRYRHRGFRVGSNIHAGIQKAQQNMRVTRNRTCQVGTRTVAVSWQNQYNCFIISCLQKGYPASTKISSPRTSTA